jgi:dsRNA-specific ribonuclease
MADVMEALLGLIYLEFGYGACREVGLELGVSLDFGDKENFAADTTTSADLENVIRACTDYQKIRCPRVLEQAFTHPSAIHTNVSSYQRLEWIGDAVVCLCIREWLLRNCTNDLGLKDLVMIEDALVSNETLALLSMKHRLPHFLNHRDQTLPGWMEAYYWRVQSGSGLWNTDPPKTVSDVAESILGAVHVDGGFFAGQAAAQKFFGPVFEIVKGAATDNGSLIRILKHPKRALQEMTGELLDLTSLNEATFAATFPDWNRVLYSERWERPMDEGTSHVSAVTILDSPVVAVADESLSISKNQACLLFLKALEDNSNLALRLARCQSKIASATTSSIIGEGSREESDDDQPDEEG